MKIINYFIMDLLSWDPVDLTEGHVKKESQNKNPFELTESDMIPGHEDYLEDYLLNHKHHVQSNYILVAGEGISFYNQESWKNLKITPFKTKSGRSAFLLEEGGIYEFKIKHNIDDNTFEYDDDAEINFITSDCEQLSCWDEITLKIQNNTPPISKEEQKYIDDVSHCFNIDLL